MSADEQGVRPHRCAETRVSSCSKNGGELTLHPCNHRHQKCQELDHQRSCPNFLTSSRCAAVTHSHSCSSSKLSCRSRTLPSQIELHCKGRLCGAVTSGRTLFLAHEQTGFASLSTHKRHLALSLHHKIQQFSMCMKDLCTSGVDFKLNISKFFLEN